MDFSQYIPGPYATWLLAQMGAEVVKVERPGGEAMRSVGPRDSDGVSAFYKTVNSDKSIVELDLKAPRDREVFATLLEHADVLVESFRPGVIERLGFGPEQLKARCPRLVVCSISGYGQNGPYRLRPGHDINYLAFSGLLAGTGTREAPVAPSPPVSDYASALQAAATVLGAVVSRQRTGRGAWLDVGMADTVLAWQSTALSNLSRSGYPLTPRRGGRDRRQSGLPGLRDRGRALRDPGGAGVPFLGELLPRRPSPAMDRKARGPHAAKRAHRRGGGTLRRPFPLALAPAARRCGLLFRARPGVRRAYPNHPQVAARRMVRREEWPDPLVQTSFPAWIDG